MKIKALLAAARVALVASALVAGIGAAQAQQFDAKKFFDRLQAEGNSAPKDFDAKKFFDKLQAEGNSSVMPPMVDMKK